MSMADIVGKLNENMDNTLENRMDQVAAHIGARINNLLNRIDENIEGLLNCVESGKNTSDFLNHDSQGRSYDISKLFKRHTTYSSASLIFKDNEWRIVVSEKLKGFYGYEEFGSGRKKANYTPATLSNGLSTYDCVTSRVVELIPYDKLKKIVWTLEDRVLYITIKL